MPQILMEKIDHIENLLMEINSKIDNFLGFEELDEDELKELKELQKEVEAQDVVSFDEVFGD